MSAKLFHELSHRQQREFYKEWLRSKPCCWCGTVRRIGSYNLHASHHNFSTKGPSGTGLKSSDYRCVPLCYECHARYHASGCLWDPGLTSDGRIALRTIDYTQSKDFLQRATIDLLVEFIETMLNPETL